MPLHIVSLTKNLTLHQLKESLEHHFSQSGLDIPLCFVHSDILKGIDPTILSASVGAAGALLGALITSVLQVLKSKLGQKIIIVSKTGARIEIPVNASPEQIDFSIGKIRELDSDELQMVVK